ncbi:MAG: transporter substrate-binding domain-containing protein [Desulfamplus sp.]|nr:transporter substrate-binding domain-containing protein [Desulfamplus sp.]
MRELLKKEGITLIVDFFPWLRSKHNAKKEEYLGYFPAWPEEVDDGFVASKPVDWSEVSILKQAGSNVSFNDIDDLFKKYKVGIVQTYVYPKLIDDAMKKYPNHADKAPDEVSLLKKLSSGRHPVAITDPNVMLYLAAKEGISNIEVIEGTAIKKELVIALRNDKENKKRIDLLEKILKDK